MKVSLILALPVLLASCAPQLPTVGLSTFAERRANPYAITPATDVPPEYRAALQELVDTTSAIIFSKRFIERLSALGGPYRKLRVSPWGRALTSAQVAQIYTGQDQTARPVPIILAFSAEATANATSEFNGDSLLTATVTIPIAIVIRWMSTDLETRSCAVNTLAHELTHTISTGIASGDGLFEDGTGLALSRLLRRHVVSYTVGAVAQCTMLENHQKLAGDFRECVDNWGRSPFPSGNCGA